MRSVLLSILALVTIAGSFPSAISQETARAKKLFADLQNEKTSDAAAAQLLKDARENPETLNYLAAHLPTRISAPERGEGWINSIRLSGELKIEQAAPALASLLTESDTMGGDGVITFTRLATLQIDPPGKALAQIGDPAIPAIEKVFENGDRTARFRAVYVLQNIGSKKSTEALRRQLSVEKDPNIQRVIGYSVE
jgi:HEAT repeat protein